MNSKRFYMRIIIILGFLFLLGGVGWLVFRNHISTSPPKDQTAQLQGTNLSSSIKSLKPLLLTGNWERAELVWGELKQQVNPGDTNAMKMWINLQIEIIDGVAGNGQKLLLRKLAFQELYLYPWYSINHRDWVLNKLEQKEFSDPDMQGQLSQLVKSFDRIEAKVNKSNK